jgi:PIN domain nuclease of toxin-antitoxin system
VGGGIRIAARLLLDTSALLWWLDGDRRLGRAAADAVARPGAVVFVSAASAWEIAVKRAIGKLDVPFVVSEAIERNAFFELPITVEHATAAGALPLHHRDPFDRMLVAQAQLEDLTLVTSDPRIEKYDVRVLSALR